MGTIFAIVLSGIFAPMLGRGAAAQQANVFQDWKPFENTHNFAVMYGDLISPETHKDGRVTFRIRAPLAKGVSVTGSILTPLKLEGASMRKGTDGIWSVTLGPVSPDVYTYRFNVDGVKIADPGNSFVRRGNQPPDSEVTVPGDGPAYYDIHDNVPHGLVTRHLYKSDVVNGTRELFVYTPPGYEKGRKKYPTLYLMGGSGELADGWLQQGRANNIMDNLLAEKKVAPMLIVFLNNQMMHRRLPESNEDWDNHSALVAKELRNHIIPLVEKRYRVQRNPKGRALAGLSMGGRHTQYVGLRNLDLFGSLGLLSGCSADSTSDAEILADPKTKKRLLSLFLGQGKLEDPKRFVELRKMLDENKIPYTWNDAAGWAHDWSTWRHLLHAHWLPNLFVGKAR